MDTPQVIFERIEEGLPPEDRAAGVVALFNASPKLIIVQLHPDGRVAPGPDGFVIPSGVVETLRIVAVPVRCELPPEVYCKQIGGPRRPRS